MATRPSPKIEVNDSSPVRGPGGPLSHLLQRTTHLLTGGARNGREPEAFKRSERIVDNLQEVDRALAGLPHRMMRWLRNNGKLPSLLASEPGSPDFHGASGSSLAHQLNRLAETVRRAGERFHESKRSHRAARRIENVAQHLRETISPPLMARLKRLWREHPLLGIVAVLGVGYSLYRVFSVLRTPRGEARTKGSE